MTPYARFTQRALGIPVAAAQWRLTGFRRDVRPTPSSFDRKFKKNGGGGLNHIPAGETHQFTEIGEDLTLVVVFAPPYGSRALPLSRAAYPERTGEAASSIPRRARASARSLPGSPA